MLIVSSLQRRWIRASSPRLGEEEKPDSGNDLMAQLAALVQENPELVKELLDKVNSKK